MKERTISAIKNGIVLDHLPSNKTPDIINILDLHEEEITIGKNFDSKKMGKKGLIKISDKMLTKEELNKIALIAPNATVSEIKDYELVNKFKLELPDKIDSLECFNPNCITRSQNLKTKFIVVNKSPIKLKCHYCERIF